MIDTCELNQNIFGRDEGSTSLIGNHLQLLYLQSLSGVMRKWSTYSNKTTIQTAVKLFVASLIQAMGSVYRLRLEMTTTIKTTTVQAKYKSSDYFCIESQDILYEHWDTHTHTDCTSILSEDFHSIINSPTPTIITNPQTHP